MVGAPRPASNFPTDNWSVWVQNLRNCWATCNLKFSANHTKYYTFDIFQYKLLIYMCFWRAWISVKSGVLWVNSDRGAKNIKYNQGVTWKRSPFSFGSLLISRRIVGGTRNQVNTDGITFIDPDENRFLIGGTSINVHPLIGDLELAATLTNHRRWMLSEQHRFDYNV